MNACARNLPQHFNGCTCTPASGTVTAESDVDLSQPIMALDGYVVRHDLADSEDQVEADFERAHLTAADDGDGWADDGGYGSDADTPAAVDPVLDGWRNTTGFVVMFEPLPPGTPEGWSGASVMSANGTRWNLRYIPKGSLIGHRSDWIAAEDTIGFYDATHTSDDWPHGQKVADYYLDTLMPANGPSVASGLNLHGGEPKWQIDAESMRGVLGWADMTRSAQEPKGPKRHTWSTDPNLVKPPKAAVSLVTDAEDAGMKVDVQHGETTVEVAVTSGRDSVAVTWMKGDYYDEPDRGKLPFRTGGTPTKGVRFYMANGHIHGQYPTIRSARQARLYIGLPEK